MRKHARAHMRHRCNHARTQFSVLAPCKLTSVRGSMAFVEVPESTTFISLQDIRNIRDGDGKVWWAKVGRVAPNAGSGMDSISGLRTSAGSPKVAPEESLDKARIDMGWLDLRS